MDTVEPEKKLTLEEAKLFVTESLQRIFGSPDIKTIDVNSYPIFPVNTSGHYDKNAKEQEGLYGTRIVIDVYYKSTKE
jgi:hypothetical protein